MTTEPRLPLAQVTFVFGVLSIPFAFLRHLCSLAVVLGVLAIAFHYWGRRRERLRSGHSTASLRTSARGVRLAWTGTACALLMWVLWASGILL